jgi:hypothetical protein
MITNGYASFSVIAFGLMGSRLELNPVRAGELDPHNDRLRNVAVGHIRCYSRLCENVLLQMILAV